MANGDPVIDRINELTGQGVSSFDIQNDPELIKLKEERDKPEDQTEVLEDVSVETTKKDDELLFQLNEPKKKLGVYKSFVNVFENIIPQAGQGLRIQQLASDFPRLYQEIDDIEKSDKTSFELAGRVDPFSGRVVYDYGNKEEAIKFRKDELIKTHNNFMESFSKYEEYQQVLDKIEQAKVFDKDGLTFSDVRSIVGTQGAQMLGTMFTFGLSTYAQESTDIAMDLLSKEVVKKTGMSEEEYYSMPVNLRAFETRKLVETGEHGDIFTKAATSAKVIAGLDFVGGFIGIGKAAKIMPKEIFVTMLEGNVRRGLGKLAAGIGIPQAIEVGTELTQEQISKSTKEGINVKSLLTLEEAAETAAQTIIGMGPVQAAPTVIKSYRDFVLEKDARSISSISAYAKVKIENEISDPKKRKEALNIVDAVEQTVRNSKYKNLNIDGRKVVFDNLLELGNESNTVNSLNKQLQEIKEAGGDVLSIQAKIDNANNKILDINKNINLQVQADNHITQGKRVGKYVNSRTKGVFANKNMIFFKTREEAKTWLEKNNPKALNQQNVKDMLSNEALVNGVRVGDTAYMIDQNVVENVNKNGIVSTADNVVWHEGLHFLTDGISDADKMKLRYEIDQHLKNSKDPKLNQIYDVLQARLSVYGEDIKYEEYLPSLSDAIRILSRLENSDQASSLDAIANSIMKYISLGNKDLEISGLDAQGAIDFIKKYNNFNGTKPVGEIFSDLTNALPTTPKGVDIDQTAQASKELGTQIKELVPPNTTKQQYDSEVIGDVYNDLVIGDRLNGLIRGQLNKFGVTGDNVFGKSISNFVEDVKQQLFERSLTRFNPETNNDLGGFVVSELQQFRIGDVVNRYRREQAGSLDIQVGETGSIRTPVADEAVDVDTDVVIKSQLKQNLSLDNNNFVDDDLDVELETNTLEIIEGVTPEINDKDFKTYIKDAAQQKSFKSIKNKLKNFDKFLEDNINVLFGSKNLPIATLVAMERRTPAADRIFTGEPTRLTTQAQIDKAIDEGDFYVENEKQGPSKYPRKKPTIEEVKKFFFDVGASTKGTRKDGLVNALAFSLFRDYAPGTMNRANIVAEDIAKISEKLIVDPRTVASREVDKVDTKKLIDKAKQNAGTTRFSKKVSGNINISRIEDAKRSGFTPNPKYTNAPKKLYDRNKKLPESVRAFEGETVIQGISRVTNNFLSRFPQYEQFLNKSLTFGVDRSPFGVQELWNKTIVKRKSKEQASSKKPNYTSGRKIRLSWYESTRKPDYVKNELKKLDDLIQFYKDFNEYYKDNKKDIWFLDEIAVAAQNAQTSPLRGNAPTFLVEREFGTKKPLINVQGVEEHTQPQNEAISILTGGVVDGNINETAEIIKATYMQGFLSLKNNDLLDIDYKSTVPDLMYTAIENNLKLDPGLLSVIRLSEAGVDLTSIEYIPTKQLLSEYFFNSNNVPLENQRQLINQLFKGEKSLDQLKKEGEQYNKISYASRENTKILNDLNNYDKALRNARDLNAPKKGISIFDFDDTVATSNSKVVVDMPDGSTKEITPAEFAKQHSVLEQDGATFDFSQFNKVVDGKPGPLAVKIKKQIDKFGSKDVYILTARPQASATSIKAFLDGIGINIPLKNITGLEDGSPKAKSDWVVSKAAEGYNDFYFTDDVYKNVKAVQDALEVLDVKSKTRLAYSDRVKKLDRDFNDIIEAKTGIAAEKEYGKTKAEVVGANKGKFTFFIPPSAEDFVGLLYNTLSKGKLGDSQMAWYKKNLLDPYASAMSAISRERITLMEDYKALKKQLGVVPKDLNKKIPGDIYTNEQAVRVYIWNKQGMTIPGLSKADLKELTDYIDNKPELKVFGDQLIAINKDDGYAAPTSGWLAGTTTTDIMRGLGTTKRAKHLQQWQQNVDIIFSEKNLNKLEAANGKPYRVALEGILQRMKTGRNRSFTGDSMTGKVTDWLTNSIGTIMFFNTRSALLQTISAVNFVNFTDNNIFKAGKAYANQKQFWKDFMSLMNSEFLVDRRRGLRINVNEADIANMANESGARGVVAKMLEIGFLPTQIADSFAIASGGATFYRNRINTYKKQGLSDQQAQEKAFNDFREIAEESQQSSRPDRISQQQAGPLGRIILAFANTPMQYARLIKKAASDLKNRRGDVKTNISKIIYYGFVQNLIFNALQQAIFAIGFGNIEEEEDEKEKYLNTANSMVDSLLRGIGIAGAFTSVGKNIIVRVIKESQKKNPKYEKISFDLARISPPISSKLSRLNQAGRAFQWQKKEMIDKGFAIDNPALMAGANVISAATNVPVDRLIRKANNVNTAVSQDLELWERFALLGGWQAWELGIEENDKKKGKKTFGSFKNTKLKKLKPLKTKLKKLN
jgi:hypothetical protein